MKISQLQNKGYHVKDSENPVQSFLIFLLHKQDH